MRGRELGGASSADGAHGQMDRPWHQPGGKTIERMVLAAKNNLSYRVVVGQHADDELAVEQVADIRRGREAERLEFGPLAFAPNIGAHRPPGGREVCGHRRAHAPKPYDPYLTHDRWANR